MCKLSLLDNAPNYLVGCVIQKRILYFCFLQDGNKVDICADSGLPYGECHKGEKLEHDMEQILKIIPKGMLKTHYIYTQICSI